MSRREVLIWTCDRCRAACEVPTHKANGDMNGLPDGWRHVRTQPSLLDVDLCDACAGSLWKWWEAGFAALREGLV